MHILVIEDDADVAAFITRGLGEQGWEVTHQPNPQKALLELGGRSFDALVLDRMLPEMDGMDALRLLRGAGITLPVIMLTAMSGLDDRVAGLEAGADDYLGKPFAMSELVARLKSLARRPAMAAPRADTLTLCDLRLDRLTREAHRGDTPLDLSPLEFKLLDCLMSHEGEVVTRSMLLEEVWGYRFDPKTSLVQTHMSRLRTKVDKPFATDLIRTIRGSGYVISAPSGSPDPSGSDDPV